MPNQSEAEATRLVRLHERNPPQTYRSSSLSLYASPNFSLLNFLPNSNKNKLEREREAMEVVVCGSSCFYSSSCSLPSTEIQCKRKSKKLFGPVNPKKRFSSSSIYAVNTSSNQESVQSVKLQPRDPFSNSALEQLDIERGVCIPFRKYSPESVCKIFLIVPVHFLHFIYLFCYLR